ncbi:uncharacterized protein N7473_002966 [Penicillium subrubescens]|uniref:Cell wall mannoprotein PIR1-like C-terminal domain-containing protein n=1 Tax=Penicillium subrubescens TaxID=1316194 RepID=A0A1Q5TDK5_9EURO|nr:uncharacterized protein N7473_002966 [Penicillium subrubescens]KAJ5906050.1 hypothetical protein N7473_002966 [Penicillium subrubescens]OKO98311.1 hypothetical protein PENSUB_9409 [Penicillium subrubescens]
MKSFIAIATLAVGANALVGRSDSCCFHLTASGDKSGSLGQLSDGKVRVGDNSLSAAKFCLSGGVITDSEGRGCVVTSETTQFQCDAGSAGTSGFSLSSSGSLEFNGSSSFVACATGQNNGDNIYTTESDSVTQCVSVKLTADSTCAAASSSSVASIAPAPTSVPVSTPIPSGSSPVGASSSSSVSAPASTPLVGSSSSIVTKTSSTALASTSSAAGTTASSASSASSTAAPASSSTAASAATRFELGKLAAVMVVLSIVSVFFV